MSLELPSVGEAVTGQDRFQGKINSNSQSGARKRNCGHFFFIPNRLIEEVLSEVSPPRYITWHLDLIGKSFGRSDLGESSDLFAELRALARTMHFIKNRFCYCYFMQTHFH